MCLESDGRTARTLEAEQPALGLPRVARVGRRFFSNSGSWNSRAGGEDVVVGGQDKAICHPAGSCEPCPADLVSANGRVSPNRAIS